MLRPTIVDCSAVAQGLSFCERATREKGARTDEGEKSEKNSKNEVSRVGYSHHSVAIHVLG